MFSLPMPGRCYHFAARTEGEMITWKREISKMCNFMEELRDGEATVDEVDGKKLFEKSIQNVNQILTFLDYCYVHTT